MGAIFSINIRWRGIVYSIALPNPVYLYYHTSTNSLIDKIYHKAGIPVKTLFGINELFSRFLERPWLSIIQ